MKSPRLSHRSLQRSLLSVAALLALAPPSAMAVDYSWSIGNLSASGVPASLGAGDTLFIGAGNYKYVDTGLSTGGPVTWTDNLYFVNGNTISSSGLWDATTDAAFADSGYGGVFINSGTFRKSAGSGNTTIQSGIAFSNSGTIDAQTGSIVFASGQATFNAGSTFTGAGTVAVTNNASFNGAFTSQNLQLAAGTYTGTGAQINGSVNWITGTLAGDWQVASGQALNLQAGNYKYINGSVTNNGTMTALDNLYFQNGSTLTNNGLYNIQNDASLSDSGYGGTFFNNAVLRKSAGVGSSTFNSGVAFVNGAGGVIDTQSGSIVFASGNSTFNAGTQFTGAGQAQVTSNATFNGAFNSQNLQLLAGGFTGNGAQINGHVNWTTGTLGGSWEVAAGQSLTLLAGNYKYLNGSLTNNGLMAVQDNLYLQNGNLLTNNGLYDMQGDIGLSDGGYNGTFTNNGIFRKSSGGGTSYVQGVTFTNNGEINPQSGIVQFQSGATTFNNGTQFTGAGQVVVNTSASFVGGFTTANNLFLTNGTFTGGDGSAGSKAVMNGNTAWSVGTLAGYWEVAAGRTLTLQSGNYKYVNGSLTNFGVMAAQDNLYLENGNLVTNNGLYDMQGDIGLSDGGYSGTFTNNGVFRKSAGVGTSYVQGTTFTNNGEINAQSGVVQFQSGNINFNNGTQFTGAGSVVVNTSATFVGTYTTAGNLSLTNGTFTGGDGSAGSKAVMNGNTAWSVGTLAGNWEVAAGRTLTLQSGNYKYVNGTVTNKGTVAAQDQLLLQNGNTVNNAGRYDLQGDVGVADGGYNGYFVNTGLLVKTAGGGSSNFSGINLVNAAGGVIDVQTGDIRLPSNFSNSGTLKGSGSYSLNGVLSNDGHVAPGESPGTLTINGNFAQTAAGFFDVELNQVGTSDLLLINGTAALDGTLALQCYGSCHYAVGDEIVVLDATGTLSGTFSQVTLSGFGSGAFETIYDSADSRVLLRVTDTVTAAVPEPGTWAMMLGGVALLLMRRRAASRAD
jgi:hypothetical protein